jgi:hypothetical protein
MSDEINILISDLMKSWDKIKYNDLMNKLENENKLLDEIENIINIPISPNNINLININDYKEKINSTSNLNEKLIYLKELYNKFTVSH